MTEYIEREAALSASKIVYIEYIEIDGDGYEDGNADEIPVVFKRDIEAIPAADVVPVVRCKDCKHRRDDDFCGGRGWPEQLVPEDGYCDNGARKDGDVWRIS